MSDELKDIISQATAELNPIEDNQPAEPVEETETEEVLESDEALLEDDTDDEVELDEEESEEELEEEENTDESNGEKYVVKVDGQKFEVTLDELKAGYQRQADYTREKQALKQEVEQIEEIKNQYSTQLTALEELDTAWEENPVTVLTHLATNTENPTQALAMMIRDMAAMNVLDPEFMSMFGITPQIQSEWRQQREVDSLRTAQTRNATSKERELEDAKMEIEVQKAIAEYDRQIDDIIDAEGFEFTNKQRTEFRTELARYAAENELTNLKTAYKAFKFDESQKKQKLAAKTVEKAKAKKATNVVSRQGEGQGNPLQDNSDLSAVIRQAMKEANS